MDLSFSTDCAIQGKEYDLLGRASFSEQLGRAIYDNQSSDSLVVGLYGEWGTGKTSVANMILQEIEELSVNDTESPIILRFEPWNYSDKDNLISQFFASLKSGIDLVGSEDKKNIIGKALTDYAEVFEFASLIPMLGGPLASVLKSSAKSIGEELSKPQDLNASKEKLKEALTETNQKIIVLIDDIDRLTNSQIRDIFQLVKKVGDLPNITYILLMDREIVSRALSAEQKCDGNEYLEKIIQIPFEIPTLSRSKLHAIFFSKLDAVMREIPADIIWEKKYFDKTFKYCIEPYLLTLRDVNRVINTFKFRYNKLYEETSFEDMLSITTFEVLRPELYKWIAKNKEALCGGLMHSMLTHNSSAEDNRKQCEDEFERIGLDKKEAVNSVAALFPVFAKDVDAHFYGFDNNIDLRKKMCVAQAERFDLYFAYNIDDVKVSRKVIEGCIFSYKKEEIEEIVNIVNSRGDISYFLEEVRAMVELIPQERLSVLASIILAQRNTFNDDSEEWLFFKSSYMTAEFLVEDILRRMETNDERFEIYKDVILEENKNVLGDIAYEIRKIEKAYGRYTKDKQLDTEGQLIDIEHLEALEKLFLDRVEYYMEKGELLSSDRFTQTFFLWKDIDNDGASEFVNNTLEDDIEKLRFICKFAGKWSGTSGTGWSFNSNNYSEYISEKEIYDDIINLSKSMLDMFTELEKIQLASFYLNYNKNEYMHVPEQIAVQLVDDWEKKGDI